MKQHRGMAIVFVILIGGLLLALGWMLLGQHYRNIVQDPERFQEFLVSQGQTEEAANYSVGITNTFGTLAAAAFTLHNQHGSYERLCDNGKVSRTEQEVVNDVVYVLCGPSLKCEGVPYFYRPQADDRCYASKDEYAISANIYDKDGALVPLCMDATGAAYDGPAIANPATLRCDLL